MLDRVKSAFGDGAAPSMDDMAAIAGVSRAALYGLFGSRAALLEGGEEVARTAAPRVRAVDGTAAGDAFTACLVVSLLLSLFLTLVLNLLIRAF